MEGYKIIEVKESVFANNNKEADELRGKLKDQGIFLLNLMSSPGSGKTTTLKGTIAALKDDLKIGVMEADIDSMLPPSRRPEPKSSSSIPAACAIWTQA